MRQVGVSQPGELDLHPDTINLHEVGDQTQAVGSPGERMDEGGLIERLRQGDEEAFVSLVERYHGSLVRLALAHVSDRSIAEEVVQESWIAVLEGLDRFEGRSSLKTWMFRIVTNKAKTRGVRESRHSTFSDCAASDDEGDDGALDPARFRTSGHWADYWEQYPQAWEEETPEKFLLVQEAAGFLEQAIGKLPANLRQVLILRDVEGLSAKDVCDMLELSEANQRVLLHRARTRIRRALDQYMKGGVRPA